MARKHQPNRPDRAGGRRLPRADRPQPPAPRAGTRPPRPMPQHRSTAKRGRR